MTGREIPSPRGVYLTWSWETACISACVKPGTWQHGHQPQNLLLLLPCRRMLSWDLGVTLGGAFSGQGRDKSCFGGSRHPCLVSRFLSNYGPKSQLLGHHLVTLPETQHKHNISWQLEMLGFRGAPRKDPQRFQACQDVGLRNHGSGLWAHRRREEAMLSHLARAGHKMGDAP